MNNSKVMGVMLIVIGALLLLARFLGAGGEIVVTLIGAGFLVAYAYSRNYGFLVPGGIMTGLGLGVIVEVQLNNSNGAPVILGLGMGFISIYLINMLTKEKQADSWWPLIPGGILTVIGISLLAETIQVLQTIGQYWPILLILAGIIIILSRKKELEK